MRKLTTLVVLGFIALFTLGNTSCDDQSSREQNETQRESNMQRANKVVPIPVVNNYAAREAVAKQVKRMDQTGKLYYIYLMSVTGTQIGYYVGNTRPVSVCATLTPVDDINYNNGNMAVTKAPGLQGTYGGGNCSNSFFFDAATDAYIEYPTAMGIVTDQPLSIKSDAIRVVSEPPKK